MIMKYEDMEQKQELADWELKGQWPGLTAWLNEGWRNTSTWKIIRICQRSALKKTTLLTETRQAMSNIMWLLMNNSKENNMRKEELKTKEEKEEERKTRQNEQAQTQALRGIAASLRHQTNIKKEKLKNCLNALSPCLWADGFCGRAIRYLRVVAFNVGLLCSYIWNGFRSVFKERSWLSEHWSGHGTGLNRMDEERLLWNRFGGHERVGH